MSNTIVFTNGCFERLHQGHKDLLQYCRRLAGPEGKLVVGLNTDCWMRLNKNEPSNNWQERAMAIHARISGGPNESIRVDTEQDIMSYLCWAVQDGNKVYLVKGMDYKGKPITGEALPGVTTILVPLTTDSHGRKLSSSNR